MKKQLPYSPRPARGMSFPGHIRINRAQLKKLFQNPAFTFTGFIVGNNVNSFHFFGGWYLACHLENKSKEDMEAGINGFEFHLDRELGNRAAIFYKIPKATRKTAFVPICASLPALL